MSSGREYSFGKTYPAEFFFGKPCGVAQYGVGYKIFVTLFAVDHQIVCIEVEAVFVGEIHKVVNTYL